MTTKTLTTLSALMLAAFAGTQAAAEERDAELAWQQPGYVMEVVVVTAPRPKNAGVAESTADATLAWQQPGYTQEVVIVRASRREVLEAALPRMRALLESRPVMGLPRN